jgi:hypothetical protein
MGFRAPAVAPELFGAAGAVAAWALLAAGALGIHGPIGLEVHRRGLLVVAAGLLILPLASAKLTHAELDVPCVLVAAVLFRVGLVRWDGLGEPDRTPREATPTPAVVPAPTGGGTPTGTGPRGITPARNAGRLAGRAGTALGREAGAALPRAARVAGRALGRARQEPPQR